MKLKTPIFFLAITTAVIAGCVSGCSGCSSGLNGTYSDANGGVLLELRSGGSANLTFAGQIENCTYASSGKTINLTCKGEATPVAFTVHDDGSLTGPPGSFMPMLRKHK